MIDSTDDSKWDREQSQRESGALTRASTFGAVEVLAGPYPRGTWTTTRDGMSRGSQTLAWSSFVSVDVVTSDNRHELGRTAGTAAVGALLLGPLGLIAGGLFGKKTTIVFVATEEDGDALLLKADAKTFEKILAATF